MDQTAFQFSGVLWNIFDHVLGLFVVALTVHVVSRIQKDENYKLPQAVYVAVTVIIYSLLIELTLPLKFMLYSIPITFLVDSIVCKLLLKLNWKRALIMGTAILLVTIIVGIFQAILFHSIKSVT